MAQLTGDQIAVIGVNSDYQNRIQSTLILKAEYFKELSTPNRADVNRRTQKRKQLAKAVFASGANQFTSKAAQHWIGYYQTSSPVLDGNGIPTYNEIFNGFDQTFDYLSGYLIGDENETEIDW